MLVSHPERLEYGCTSIFLIQKGKDLWGYRFEWKPIRGYHCSTHILKNDYSNCKVIGNIFENSELLEEE